MNAPARVAHCSLCKTPGHTRKACSLNSKNLPKTQTRLENQRDSACRIVGMIVTLIQDQLKSSVQDNNQLREYYSSLDHFTKVLENVEREIDLEKKSESTRDD